MPLNVCIQFVTVSGFFATSARYQVDSRVSQSIKLKQLEWKRSRTFGEFLLTIPCPMKFLGWLRTCVTDSVSLKPFLFRGRSFIIVT